MVARLIGIVALVVVAGCGLAADDMTDDDAADEGAVVDEQPTAADQGAAVETSEREAWGYPYAPTPDDPDTEASGGAGLLPHPYPETLPLPADSEISASYGVGPGANVTLRVPSSFDEVVAFFDDALVQHGWDIVEREGRDAPIQFERLQADGHGHEARIRIEHRDDRPTSVMLEVRAVG